MLMLMLPCRVAGYTVWSHMAREFQ